MAIKPGDSLQLGLGLDTDGFEQGAKKVDRSLSEIQKALAQSKAALAGFQAELAATKNVAVQAGQALDKTVAEDFKKNISASRAEIAKLNAELAKTQASGAGATPTKDGASFDAIKNNVLALTGVITAGYAAFAGFKSYVLETSDQLSDLGDSVGIAASRVLDFRAAVTAAGGSAEKSDQILLKLNENIGKAAEGTQATQQAFKELGVKITDASGKVRATDEVYTDLIKALSDIEDPATRAAKAVELLGKGAKGLDFTKMSAAFDGIDLTPQIKALGDAKDASDALNVTLQKTSIIIGSEMAGAWTAFSEYEKRSFDQLNKDILAFGSAWEALAIRLKAGFWAIIAEGENKSGASDPIRDYAKKKLDEIRQQAKTVRDEFDKTIAANQKATQDKTTKSAIGGGYGKAPSGGTNKDLTESIKTQLSGDLEVLKVALAQFKTAYDQNLVSIQEYYTERGNIIQREAELEKKAYEDQRKVLEGNVGKAKTPQEAESAKAEISKLDAEYRKKSLDYGQQLLANDLERVKAQEKYNDGIKEINLALLDRQGLGDSEEARLIRMEQIASKYAEQLKQALVSQDEVGAAAIQRMIDMQQRAANIASIASNMQRELGGNTAAQAQATMEGATGQSTQLETQQRLNALKQEEINLRIRNLEAQKAEAEAGADKKATEELSVQIELLKIKLEELKPRFADLAVVARQTLQNGLEDALGSIINRTKSVGDAFRDLGKTILQSIANAAVKNAVAGLFGAFGGGVGTSLSQAAYAGISGFAEGGHVKGPGTGTSDSIPARLSNGEFVVRANATRMLGVDFLNKLNNVDRGAIPNSNRLSNFAGGGMVSAPTSTASAPISINIQNSGQPKDAQATTQMTPEGMIISVVMKDISNNGPITQGINAQSRIRR